MIASPKPKKITTDVVSPKKEKKSSSKSKDKKDKEKSSKDKDSKEKSKKDKKSSKKDKESKSSKKTRSSSKSKSKKSSETKKKDEIQEKSAEEAEPVCCVCKNESIKMLVTGLCEHYFCAPCIESVLFKPLPNPQLEDAHLAAPTLGRCPDCHAELGLFALQNNDGLMLCKDYDVASSPIGGKIYKCNDPKQQLGDLCFDINDSEGHCTPYMDFSNAVALNPDDWTRNDGTLVPDRVFFERGTHFHAKTRTFHGKIKWNGPRFQGSHSWNVVFAFAKDFASIRVGVLIMHKERTKLSKIKAIPKEDRRMNKYLYPLDGKWKIFWTTPEGEDKSGSVTVSNNGFRQGPYNFNINFEDDMRIPSFRWPLDPIHATAVKGLDMIDEPEGPPVGERIVWKTDHPAFETIGWERLSIGGKPLPETRHIGPGMEYEYNLWTGDEEEDAKSRKLSAENKDDEDVGQGYESVDDMDFGVGEEDERNAESDSEASDDDCSSSAEIESSERGE